MMFVRCKRCDSTFSVVGGEQELVILDDPQWKVNFPCIIPMCAGRADRVHAALAAGATPVPLAAFYRAIQGFGYTGAKAPAEPATVLDLLQNRRVATMSAFPIGSPVRTIIRSITFEDGTVMHFESSSGGACVYFVEEAIRERSTMDAISTDEGGSTGRSEARLSSAEVTRSDCPADPLKLQGDSVSAMPESDNVQEDTAAGRLGRADSS